MSADADENQISKVSMEYSVRLRHGSRVAIQVKCFVTSPVDGERDIHI